MKAVDLIKNRLCKISRKKAAVSLEVKKTETINKENGCLFKLDLAKVMWSKGNNNERLRIAKLVGDGETVIDMFAGIGYFSIHIAVHSNAKRSFPLK